MSHLCPLCSGHGTLTGEMLDHPARTNADRHVPAFVGQLQPGRRGVRSSYDIATNIGVGQRSVGFIANAARQQGMLVGSIHGEGYYLIRTQSELDETIGHILSRVSGIGRTIEALRRSWADHQRRSDL